MLIDGQAPDTDDESRWAVACYDRAVEHIQVLSADPSFRWLVRVVLDLHFDACQFERDKSPRLWRTGSIHVTGSRSETKYTAPPAEDVQSLMGEAIEWLATGDLDQHVAVRAAMAHLHVVSIHPFREGSGRSSRLIRSLVLARDALPSVEFGFIEPLHATHTLEYHAQLQRAHGAT